MTVQYPTRHRAQMFIIIEYLRIHSVCLCIKEILSVNYKEEDRKGTYKIHDIYMIKSRSTRFPISLKFISIDSI